MSKLIDLNGVGPVLANACIEHGYRSVADIAAAREDELVIVPGISNARARVLIDGAKALLNGGVPPVGATVANVNAELKTQDVPTEGDGVKMSKKNKKKENKKAKKDSKKKSKKSSKKKKNSNSKKKKSGKKK